MRKLLERWTLDLRIRPIYHNINDNELYMKRYYVCTLFNYWRVYLHHFVANDPDGLHNHPFKWAFSIILAGNYWEMTRRGLQNVRWFNLLGPDTLHRVELNPGQSCWSLFFHSPRVTSWGFLQELPKGNWLEMTSPEIFRSDDPYNTVLIKHAAAVFMKVGQDNPTRLSDWSKSAPTGREWEAMTDEQQRACAFAYKA